MLDHEGIDNCHLIGNSLGGAIALKFALDYPQQANKLLLMAPGGIEQQESYFTMPGMQVMRDTFMSAEPMTFERMKTFISEALVYQQHVVTDSLVAERFEVMKTQNPQVIKTMVVPNMEDRLGEIDSPILVMWGLNENMMPETGIMKLGKKCRNVRIVLVSNCGHWVMGEHEDLFNRTAVDFLLNG
jgi:4,5:9,10-diseco-3-hydroxy-5,9,17-trioxoandrosta-1(10),2-diene-4-oate hydrolase